MNSLLLIMLKIYAISFLLLLSSTVMMAQGDSVKVRVEVVTHDLDDTSAVYIAGNHKKLGGWHPGKIKLENNNGRWTGEYKFVRGTHLEYKFTLGTWTTEALNDDSTKMSNNVHDVKVDTLLSYTVNVWRERNKVEPKFNGQVTGQVEYHRNVKMEGLESRDLIVWLPPFYNDDTDSRFPVYYMHDGQNMFDPETSTFGIDWQMDEAADSLIKKGEIEPIIIVGITNTKNRTKEYTPSDTSGLYMDLVINVIKPLIDSKYRTKPEREFTVTGGSSAGGTISFMLLWERNDVFSKAICMSPALKIMHIDLVASVKSYRGEKKNIRLYMDNGGRGVDERLQPGIDEMVTVLKDQGYTEKKDFILQTDDKAAHTEAEWAKRIPDALRFLSNK